LKLALPLAEHGVPIWGTSPESIDLAEDREKFNLVLDELHVKHPRGGMARSREEALTVARELGFPVLVRPSYVLGGRAMAICYDQSDLEHYIAEAVRVSPEHPILIDEFLQDAIEVDVDAVADGTDCVIGGIMEHIERAGIHSGDSCCVLPPFTLSAEIIEEIRAVTKKLAQRLRVVGLMNIQFAVQKGTLYVLEVNPRASRTVPFVSKATGVPLAKLAAKVMAGMTLRELGLRSEPTVKNFHVKAPVFPFDRFFVDPILGPEMKSTGEVMGSGRTLGEAFAKTQMSLKSRLPTAGRVFVSVNDRDKECIVPLARALVELGFEIIATRGTAERLRREGLPVQIINKISEGHPHIGDALRAGEIALVINTPRGKRAHHDEAAMRIEAVKHRVPYVTTIEGARAVVEAIRALREDPSPT
jgi:carbamoyl-phosphate synthase large subunit